MASKTSKPIVVDRGTAGGKSYYVTDVTTLANGGVLRETYRSDDKGNKQAKIQTVKVDGSGNIIEDTVNTCLLYTSPSPRDRTRSRMPSSA